jgi:hypothetical protein
MYMVVMCVIICVNVYVCLLRVQLLDINMYACNVRVQGMASRKFSLYQ